MGNRFGRMPIDKSFPYSKLKRISKMAGMGGDKGAIMREREKLELRTKRPNFQGPSSREQRQPSLLIMTCIPG